MAYYNSRVELTIYRVAAVLIQMTLMGIPFLRFRYWTDVELVLRDRRGKIKLLIKCVTRKPSLVFSFTSREFVRLVGMSAVLTHNVNQRHCVQNRLKSVGDVRRTERNYCFRWKYYPA